MSDSDDLSRAHEPPAPRDVPAWFARLARFGWGFLGIVGGAGVVVLGLAALRELVIPLILAVVFAIVFAPAMDWLAERGISRGIGAILMLGVTVAIVWGAVAIVVVGLADQADELADRFDEVQVKLEELTEQSDVADYIAGLRDSSSASGSTLTDGLGSSVGSFLGSAAGIASGLVLGTVLLYYLLKDGPELTRWALQSRNPQSTATNERIFAQAGSSIRGYFKGKTALAVAQGLFIGIVLSIMDVPLAGSIGVVNFIAAYIPFLGAFIGGAFAVLMALSEGGAGLALAALAVVLFTNVVLENVLEPRFLGASLNLHPIVVLLSTVAGGAVAGMLGLILAAPFTSIGINLYHELRDSGFFDDNDEPRAATRP